MKHDLDEPILRLIIQSLEGTIEEKDRAGLDEWLENQENQEAFDELEMLWQKAPKAAHFEQVNVQKDYEALKQKLRQKTKRRTWYWAAAASLVFIALSGYYALEQWNNAVPIEYAASSAIQRIGLSDGTVVHLNEGATLVQEGDFGESTRTVTLTGEGFFEVAKNPDKPFLIKTGRTRTRVLGTAFNITQKDDETRISVEHGSVSFSVGAKEVILAQDEAGVFTQENEALTKGKAGLNYLSWKTGVLTFDHTPAMELFRDIEQHYNIDIETVKPIEQEFTSTFRNESLEQVLEEISLVLDLEIRQEGTTIFID